MQITGELHGVLGQQMHAVMAAGFQHQVRKAQAVLHQLLLGGFGQEPGVRTLHACASLGRGPEDRGDACVRVLDVIDRVLVGLLLCQLEVEVEL